jgi:hypothetical protein
MVKYIKKEKYFSVFELSFLIRPDTPSGGLQLLRKGKKKPARDYPLCLVLFDFHNNTTFLFMEFICNGATTIAPIRSSGNSWKSEEQLFAPARLKS